MKLLLLIFVFSGLALADVIFIDLNINPNEIAAAKAAASKRGEKLIIIPDSASKFELQKEYEKVEAIGRKLVRLYDDLTTAEEKNDTRKIESITKKIKSLSIEQNAREDKYQKLKENNNLSNQELKDEIGKLSGKKISSVIISGHDGNGHFMGHIGNLSSSDFKKIFEQFPDLGENIRSIYLWGCYSATSQTIVRNWKFSLPNLQSVIGYDKTAPLGTRIESSEYLKNALVNEQKLSKIADDRKLQEEFKKLRGINSSACINDKFVNKEGVVDLHQSLQACGKEFQKNFEIYNCFFVADDKCENPPKNTGNSELRSAYNFFQANPGCKDQSGDSVNLNNLIRLIFFDNIKDNYYTAIKDKIPEIDKLLRKVNAPADIKLENLNKMNRKQILAMFDKFSNFFHNRAGDLGYLTPELNVLSRAFRTIQSKLSHLDVPFNVIEPNQKMIANFNVDSDAIKAQRLMYESQRADRDLHLLIGSVVKSEELISESVSEIGLRRVKVDEVKFNNKFDEIIASFSKKAQDVADSEYESEEGKEFYLKQMNETIRFYKENPKELLFKVRHSY